jgi:hypothetical protein
MAPPLAHANLLAKGWGAPNAYIKDADRLFRAQTREEREWGRLKFRTEYVHLFRCVHDSKITISLGYLSPLGNS